MSKAKPKAPTKPVADEAQKVEAVTEEAVVTETKESAEQFAKQVVEKLKAEPKVKEKALTITLTRDKEGRLVFEGEGIGKRIAGTDAVIPEVARQIGEEIANQQLI